LSPSRLVAASTETCTRDKRGLHTQTAIGQGDRLRSVPRVLLSLHVTDVVFLTSYMPADGSDARKVSAVATPNSRDADLFAADSHRSRRLQLVGCKQEAVEVFQPIVDPVSNRFGDTLSDLRKGCPLRRYRSPP